MRAPGGSTYNQGLGAKQSSRISLRYRKYKPQIRKLRSRHWIAAPVSILRILRVPRLAMTGWGYAPPSAHGTGTGEGGFETRPYGRVITRKRTPRPNPTSLIFDIC
ncbi:MAG: hypothetical protein LBM98_07120 [Oscillospiraceae bacterium]|nr:hypothetical protein [Oscillospiraceae bacterium]